MAVDDDTIKREDTRAAKQNKSMALRYTWARE